MAAVTWELNATASQYQLLQLAYACWKRLAAYGYLHCSNNSVWTFFIADTGLLYPGDERTTRAENKTPGYSFSEHSNGHT
jgi:hypothetical protein